MGPTDVKAKKLTATGAVTTTPARLKGMVFLADGAASGSLVFRDGGASGTIICDIPTPGAGEFEDFTLPGNGIRANTDLYVTITDVTSVTVFYDG